MENAEEIFHFLEEFSKRKTKTIPQELNDYLAYVARTGDPVYQWALVKSLFKEKLLNVITDFYETTPTIEIPPYPNVDPFNYDTMKNSLLERLDSFNSAPFTVQRICELLTYPRKQYNRVDKFMRAIEKNILVVSTREPGTQRHAEPENGEPMEPIVNGSDNNSEYNVDVEMEDMSWKDNATQQQHAEPQPGSSDTHISVDDIEARLQAKKDAPMDTQEKTTTQYESVTPPELNVTTDEPELKSNDAPTQEPIATSDDKVDESASLSSEASKVDVEMKTEEPPKDPLDIPEIKVDDAEMTEQRLNAESSTANENPIKATVPEKEAATTSEDKPVEETPPAGIDEGNLDTNVKEESEPKISSEVSTSSEESSSSSDNTDGNSNSPKTDIDTQIDVQEDTSQSDSNMEAEPKNTEEQKEPEPIVDVVTDIPPKIQEDNYSISDVNSELPQPPAEEPSKPQEQEPEVLKEDKIVEEKAEDVSKPDNCELTTDKTET